MKNILLLVMLVLLFTSCNDNSDKTPTSTDDSEYLNLIGSVKFELLRCSESGQILGKFDCSYYLSGIKAELIKDGKIIESTQSIDDNYYNSMYLFKKVILNNSYQVRVTLNEQMSQTSQSNTIIKELTLDYPTDSALLELPYIPDWVTNGKYYIGLIWGREANPIFNLYSDINKLKIYPNPIIDKAYFDYEVESAGTVDIRILDLNLDQVYFLNTAYQQPDKYTMQFGTEILDGLYILEVKTASNTLYCPFLKGKKGSPMK